MPRKKKGKELSRGPWDYAHIRKELMRVGYASCKHAGHLNYECPGRPGKVQLDKKRTGVQASSWVFKGLVAQTGYPKPQLIRILNGLDP
jgi:hypothetical protein